MLLDTMCLYILFHRNKKLEDVRSRCAIELMSRETDASSADTSSSLDKADNEWF